jgi:hypothetical protein
VECFSEVIDWLLQELDNRFNKKNSQLLVCSVAFSPRDSFRDFNVESLVSLEKIYPDDFSSVNLRDHRNQVNMYINDVREDEVFSNLNSIAELAHKIVQTRKNRCYALVYRLLKLVLVLSVATASVERCFSATKLVKTYLSNKIADEQLSYRLIFYVERKLFRKVSNDAVIRRFMNMEGEDRQYGL